MQGVGQSTSMRKVEVYEREWEYPAVCMGESIPGSIVNLILLSFELS